MLLGYGEIVVGIISCGLLIWSILAVYNWAEHRWGTEEAVILMILYLVVGLPFLGKIVWPFFGESG